MGMKASDYIVEYLIEKGITDVFGYPGGMVTHLMDSLSKYQDRIEAHVTYHEQGAAFVACGYAQASGNIGVAYATSGPGATNLITGICNAYFDSIPTVFITGQVNTFENKGNLSVRQRGFQETDIVSMIVPVTKYAVRIDDPTRLKWYLDYAFYQAVVGRKGPVLLDIPMDIFRAEIEPDKLVGFDVDRALGVATTMEAEIIYTQLQEMLRQSKYPVLLIGNGIKIAGVTQEINEVVSKLGIPVVSTMVAVDVISDSCMNYGFIGAYGNRTANFVIAKSDLVITLGARLDVRQVGAKRENFAPNSQILRIDIDQGELKYKIHEDEHQICADLKMVVAVFKKYIEENEFTREKYSSWIRICNYIKNNLDALDDRLPNNLVKCIGANIPESAIITTDVGQNQVWVAQSLEIKKGQRVFFSGGHGAMGYSLPAAIGCCVVTHKPVYSFNGDGGIQMNIQELMTIGRERLPIKIILFNNHALGMIRHFQEMYFEDNFYQTISGKGYETPDFKTIAKAYGLRYIRVRNETQVNKVEKDVWTNDEPVLIEVFIEEKTYVFPKLEFGKPNQDQEPLLDRKLYDRLMRFDEKTLEKIREEVY